MFIPYTVLAQDQTEELMPNGSFADTWTITYQGPSGTTGRVKIPAASYSPATVDAAIQTQLQSVEAVHSLGGAPVTDLTP